MMGSGRQGAALPGFKIHDVVAHGATIEGQGRILGFRQCRQVEPETAVGGFGSANGLEHQIHRRAPLYGLQSIGDMGEHTGLGRNLIGSDDIIHQSHQLDGLTDIVRGRIDADHRIAAAIEQAVDNTGSNAGNIVSGMVWLQPGGQVPRQAYGIPEGGSYPAFARHQNQILIAHQLADRRHHLRRQAISQTL